MTKSDQPHVSAASTREITLSSGRRSSEKDGWSAYLGKEEKPTSDGNQTQTDFPLPLILPADLQELINFTSEKDMLIFAKRIQPCTIYNLTDA
jgi:hypothetical protein